MACHPLPTLAKGRAFLFLGICLALALMAAACHATDTSSARPVLRVASTFAPFSTRLIEEYRRSLPDVEFQQTEAAANQVLGKVQSGELDLGVAFASEAYEAYVTSSKTGGDESRLRGLSLLQPLPLYLLVRGGLSIEGPSGLTGRTVAAGPPNSAAWTLATRLLTAFGAKPLAVKALSTREAAAAGLRDGSLDAVFLPGYVYPDEVMRTAISDGSHLSAIEGEPVQALRRDLPFVRNVIVPRDIYPGQDRLVPTVGLDILIVCRRDLDEALVFRLTDQLFKVLPLIAGTEATMRFMNLEEAPATPVPLHPGAMRFFRQRELSR